MVDINSYLNYKTKIESRIDIIDSELAEGKISKDKYKEIKSELLNEMGFVGKIKSFFLKKKKYPAMLFH